MNTNGFILRTRWATAALLSTWLVFFAMLICGNATASGAEEFKQGVQAYEAGKFDEAIKSFHDVVAAAPSSGAYYDLGNAEWQADHPGEAILAWEHAQWLDPLAKNPRNNLRFARRMRLLDTPQLAWYEICSMWLPPGIWPWLASATFWLALALVLLPGVFRARRNAWVQGMAAGSFAIFLLTLPALYGIHSRSRIAIVLGQNTPLRLTPTSEAQYVTKLAAGETVRVEREKEKYVFVRTSVAVGWMQRGDLGVISR